MLRTCKGKWQRLDTVEHTHNAQEEEIDQHRRYILDLQESNKDLQYRVEDLENRLWRSNICIRGLLTQAITGKVEDFVIHLFRHVAPDLKDQDLLLDRTHRAGRPAQSAIISGKPS
ncbi:hypothetical protein NDU88_004758 [Pleurodeles waltl]|uniref:Uncharacterized protein n=1 Tax=Pleurodeles waltl TaxID=8319 RepID=A0AAV7M996_PLEWA|nr:hypothetical protein NDU88_004758 [Pleurodeles waltl]